MSDRDFLAKMKTYYESMIDNAAEAAGKHHDLNEPKVQSLHRLVCHETTVYLRILKKIEDTEKKSKNSNNHSSPKTGIPALLSGIDKHLQQPANLMTAARNFILAAHIFMLLLCITVFNSLSCIRMPSIRQFIINIKNVMPLRYLSPINLYLQCGTMNHWIEKQKIRFTITLTGCNLLSKRIPRNVILGCNTIIPLGCYIYNTSRDMWNQAVSGWVPRGMRSAAEFPLYAGTSAFTYFRKFEPQTKGSVHNKPFHQTNPKGIIA